MAAAIFEGEEKVEFVAGKILAAALLPPGGNLVVAASGVVLLLRWRRLGVTLVVLALASLYLFSAPAVAALLIRDLQIHPALTAARLEQITDAAIVILGAGRSVSAPEYGADTVSDLGLARLRYGARLYRASRLPILLSGGSPYGEEASEARLMAEVLTADFGVQPRWLEQRSRNTAENGLYTSALLAEHGIERVVVVTHAWHMRRALAAFVRTGLEVIPAPTGFVAAPVDGAKALAWLPSAAALRMSAWAWHEHLGRWWYRIRY